MHQNYVAYLGRDEVHAMHATDSCALEVAATLLNVPLMHLRNPIEHRGFRQEGKGLDALVSCCAALLTHDLVQQLSLVDSQSRLDTGRLASEVF